MSVLYSTMFSYITFKTCHGHMRSDSSCLSSEW